jgi:hypothetical protein
LIDSFRQYYSMDLSAEISKANKQHN